MLLEHFVYMHLSIRIKSRSSIKIAHYLMRDISRYQLERESRQIKCLQQRDHFQRVKHTAHCVGMQVLIAWNWYQISSKFRPNNKSKVYIAKFTSYSATWTYSNWIYMICELLVLQIHRSWCLEVLEFKI